VTIISRTSPTCLQLLAQRARERGVQVLVGRKVTSIAETPDGVAVASEGDEGDRETASDIVVVAFGREPRLDFMDKGLLECMITDNPPETGVSGLYTVGDVVRGKNRQAAIAVGDGVLAAMMVERSLDHRGGR
jgi:thioredoxin reductase